MFFIIESNSFNSYLLFIVSFGLAFHLSFGLKCHCDVCPQESNHTCETDGLCFASASIDENGALFHSYRCFHKSDLFPPENPVICQHSESIQNKFVIKCCTDSDYCNVNLKLNLTPNGKNLKYYY
jgi:hypothetical protein